MTMSYLSAVSYLRGEGLNPSLNIYNTIPDMIKQHAKNVNRVAQIFIDWQTYKEEILTYNTLYNEAKRFARGMMRLEVKKGDIIAVGTENSPEWMVVTVGLLMCGAVPLHFLFKMKDGKDVEELLTSMGGCCKGMIFPPGKDDVNVAVVNNLFKCERKGVTVSDSLPSVKWAILMSKDYHNDRYLNINDISEQGDNPCNLPVLDPDDIAALYMTSGSTGTPKLVPYSHNNTLLSGYYFSILFGEQNNKFFNDRPFCWQAGYPNVEFYTGKTRVLIQNVSAIPSMEKYHDVVHMILHDKECKSAFLITPILQEILNRGVFDWKLHTVWTGGQPVPATLTSMTGVICERFVTAYGSTELSTIAYRVVNDPDEFSDYEVGVPFPGVEIKIVDKDGVILKRDEDGEAWVRSPVRFLGYYGNENETKVATTASGWYKTDDSARITRNGNLIVDGRLSDTRVKIGPRFVSVSSMECKLKRHPAIADVVVFSYQDASHYHCVCCAIVTKAGHELSKSELDEYMLDNEHHTEANILQQLELPRSYMFLDAFPRTYSGKIDRKKVAENCKYRLLVNCNK